MFSLRDEKKITKYSLLIIEIIFIIVGMISILKYGNSLLLGSIEKFDNDDVKYIRSAWNLIDNKILSYENIKESTVYIMPGLTFVLTFFMMIFYLMIIISDLKKKITKLIQVNALLDNKINERLK